MTPDQMAELVDSKQWTYAKTYPTLPHFYTLKKNWGDDAEFTRFANAINDHGIAETLFKFPVRKYLYVGAWRYWVMESNADTTTLINRCDPKHPIYAGKIKRA